MRPFSIIFGFGGRPEIADLGGLGGPGRPENPSNRWAATGWMGSLEDRGRPDLQNQRFPGGPQNLAVPGRPDPKIDDFRSAPKIDDFRSAPKELHPTLTLPTP